MYEDGQIITDHKAFANWANANGNKFSDRPNGDGTYTVYEVKESESEIQYRVREIRDNALEQTDKYMISDFPISDEERQQFIAYRKYLRDYTEQKDWWKMLPMNFENWCETLNKMVEKTTKILTEQEQTEPKD